MRETRKEEKVQQSKEIADAVKEFLKSGGKINKISHGGIAGRTKSFNNSKFKK